jgi:hypothetical protein
MSMTGVDGVPDEEVTHRSGSPLNRGSADYLERNLTRRGAALYSWVHESLEITRMPDR